MTATTETRPRVVMAIGMTVDARITLRRDRLLINEDAGKEWQALSPPSFQTLWKTMETQIERLHSPEANLEGSGSLAADDQGPLADLPQPDSTDGLYDDFLPKDVVERDGHEKWFTCVDGRGRVNWHLKQTGGWDVLVLVSNATPAAYLAHLQRENICYLVAGDERVDLAAALRKMREKLNVTCIQSTAGGGLNGTLLKAGLVDEINLVVVPAAIGGRDTPTVLDGRELADGEQATRLRLLSTQVESDGAIWLRYEVRRDD